MTDSQRTDLLRERARLRAVVQELEGRDLDADGQRELEVARTALWDVEKRLGLPPSVTGEGSDARMGH